MYQLCIENVLYYKKCSPIIEFAYITRMVRVTGIMGEMNLWSQQISQHIHKIENVNTYHIT